MKEISWIWNDDYSFSTLVNKVEYNNLIISKKEQKNYKIKENTK